MVYNITYIIVAVTERIQVFIRAYNVVAVAGTICGTHYNLCNSGSNINNVRYITFIYSYGNMDNIRYIL